MNMLSNDFDVPVPLHLRTPLRPTIENAVYRDAMASMGAAVCLVTARLGTDRLGRTVTSAFSLTVSPPTILCAINIDSALADHIDRTQGFSFAVLADTQQDVAEAFAGRDTPRHRFDHGGWLSWKSGHPRLVGAVATMDCELVGTIETATHVLYAGAVVDLDATPDSQPLIWHRRRYRTVGEGSPACAIPGIGR